MQKHSKYNVLARFDHSEFKCDKNDLVTMLISIQEEILFLIYLLH